MAFRVVCNLVDTGKEHDTFKSAFAEMVEQLQLQLKQRKKITWIEMESNWWILRDGTYWKNWYDAAKIANRKGWFNDDGTISQATDE